MVFGLRKYSFYSKIHFPLQIIQLVATVLLTVSMHFNEYYYALFFILLILIIFISINRIEKYLKSFNMPEIVDILRLCVKSIFDPERMGQYRISVMLPEKINRKEFLTIKFEFNHFQNDKIITLNLDQGASGRCYTRKQIVKANFDVVSHEEFGLTQEQIDMIWDKMRGLICIPIPLFEDKSIIGVLSVDSSLDFEEALFDNPTVIDQLCEYADTLGKLLIPYL